MSIRAYRVNKIETSKSDTFNLWHDSKLRDFLINDMEGNLNSDSCGIIKVSVDSLEEAIEKAKELELEEYTIESIKKDIKWAKRKKEGYIRYYCF